MNVPLYDWWVEHAHEDSAFLLLMRDAETFEQLVTAAAVKAKRTDVQGLINQCKYRAIFEQHHYGAMSSIVNDIQPTPDFGNFSRPLHGPIRVDSKSLRDDKGPFPLLGVSAFWLPWALQNNRAQFDRLALWATECGVNYVRWFGSHDWTGGIIPEEHDDYFGLMEETIEQLAMYGLRSQITLFTRSKIIEDKSAMVKQWASLINSHREKVCLVELVNEWNHPDNDWDDWEVKELGYQFTGLCNAPFALSAPAAETWDAMEDLLSGLYTDNCSATTIHFPRYQKTNEKSWRCVRQPWHGRWISGLGCPKLFIDNEHQRWDRTEDAMDSKVIEIATSAPLVAFVSGAAMSAHHDVYGVHVHKGEYSNDEHADALRNVWSTVMPLLPKDICNMESVRVGEGGGPHPFPRLVEQEWPHDSNLGHGVSRSFAAVRDDRFVMVLTGVRYEVTLHEHQMNKFKVISLRDGTLVYEGNGPSVTLSENDGLAFLVITSR
mgnify:CR=1 FL=1|tara:strand:- start:318 stop:1790 length:1473 start_codon:yes stop_codon:yes gene_type:complete